MDDSKQHRIVFNEWRILVMNVYLAYAEARSFGGPGGGGMSKEMLTGILAGFGFFVGLIIIVTIIWCFCCGTGCQKKNQNMKVVPL